MNNLKRALLGAGALALLANLFFFRAIGPTGIALSILLFTSYLFFAYAKTRLNGWILGLLGFEVLFLALSIVRATPIIQLLLLLSSLGLSGVFAFLFASELSFFPSLRYVLLLPLGLAGSYLVSFGEQFLSKQSVFRKLNMTGEHSVLPKGLVSAFAGLVLGIPVVLFLVMLLSQADPIFGKVVGDLLKNITFPVLAQRIMGTVILFVFLLPWAFLSIKKNFADSDVSFSSLRTPMTVVMVLVAITLGAFLLIQWPYVFVRVAAETDLSKYGVATYSEYVKKGFVEFLVVAGFLYWLLWAGLVTLRGKDEKKFHPLKLVQSVVIALFVVFLVSVARRIFLYWDLHGLSLIRVYGGMFLLWVAFLTFLLWLRHVRPMKYVVAEVFGTLTLIAFLGFWNAENFIISHHPPTVNDQVDYVYLSRLSADGYTGWYLADQHAKDVVLRLPENSLTEEERRELSYAGYSLAVLTRRYDTLIKRYGSPEEVRAYEDTVFIREAEHLKETALLFDAGLKVTQEKGNTATVAAEGYINRNFFYSENKTAELSRFLTDLNTGATDTARLASISGEKKLSKEFVLFVPRSPRSIGEFWNGTCNSVFEWKEGTAPGYWCVPSFYVLDKRGEKRETTFLDSLFTWNAKEASAYAQLKRDIPLADVFQTQDRYRELWKIVLSPEQKEKGVKTDISFEAPFISPLW